MLRLLLRVYFNMASELDDVLAQLGEHIKNKESVAKRFDFEDYRVVVTTERDTVNLTLEKNGVRSVSEIKEDGTIGHTELIGTNEQSLDDAELKTQRIRAVEDIISHGYLDED